MSERPKEDTMEHDDRELSRGEAPGLGGMRLKVGVMSAPPVCSSAKSCSGLPLAAACGAKEEGGLVVGISPGLSLDEYVHSTGRPPSFTTS